MKTFILILTSGYLLLLSVILRKMLKSLRDTLRDYINITEDYYEKYHCSISSSVNNWANLIYNQSEYTQLIITQTPSSNREARLLIEIGKNYEALGEWDKAMEKYSIAAELGREQKVTRAEALKRAGHIHSNQSEWEEAMSLYLESMELYRSIGNEVQVGNIYNNIGFNLFSTGETDDARHYYDMALEIARKENNPQLLADANNGKAVIADKEGRWGEAIRLYQQSITLYDEDTLGLASAYHNLGIVYAHMNDFELAEGCYERSFSLAKKLHDMRLIAGILVNKADLYYRRKNIDKSQSLALSALDIFTKLGDTLGQADAQVVLGKIYRSQKKWAKVEAALKKAIELYKQNPGVEEARWEFREMLFDIKICQWDPQTSLS